MKRFLIATALTLGCVLPGHATDLSALSDAERDQFRAEVRAYLLDNPEVLMEAIAVLDQRKADGEAADDAALLLSNADALFNDGYSYVGGNPDGDVVIVEFLDYNCGYCKKAHPEVTELINTDGNIRYIIKEFPILGDTSVLAARFAISVLQNADQSAYAKVHDALMTFRGEINSNSLEGLAKSLELNSDLIMAGMNDPSVDKVIGLNHALAQKMKINGTPSFIMGDQLLRGYVPLDGMQQIVAELRSE